ncbi:MAG: protein jag [Actinomycetota bacterium]
MSEDPGREALLEVVRAAVDGLGLDATVVVEDGEENGLIARIEGEGLDPIIGRDGDVLDAVQVLAAQAVRRQAGGQRRGVLVDAGDYRARRAELLTRLAHKAADEAVEYGEEIELEPMSALDRRTVHMALADRADIETRSEGEDPRRRIVVVPAAE